MIDISLVVQAHNNNCGVEQMKMNVNNLVVQFKEFTFSKFFVSYI